MCKPLHHEALEKIMCAENYIDCNLSTSFIPFLPPSNFFFQFHLSLYLFIKLFLIFFRHAFTHCLFLISYSVSSLCFSCFPVSPLPCPSSYHRKTPLHFPSIDSLVIVFISVVRGNIYVFLINNHFFYISFNIVMITES